MQLTIPNLFLPGICSLPLSLRRDIPVWLKQKLCCPQGKNPPYPLPQRTVSKTFQSHGGRLVAQAPFATL